MKRNLGIVVGIVLLAVVAGGSFYGGMVYGQGQAQPAGAGAAPVDMGQGGIPPAGAGGAPPDMGQGGIPPAGPDQQGSGQGAGGQGGMLSGQIQEIDTDVLKITDSSGKQIQVRVTDTTLVEKQASVTLTDLQQGETVVVSGSQESDGSITARSVQVVSAGRIGGQPGGNQAGAPGGTNP